MDVDEKGRAYIIVPVWLGKLCGKTTVFVLMYRHSMTQAGAEILWEGKKLRTENIFVCWCCVGSDRVAGVGVSLGTIDLVRVDGRPCLGRCSHTTIHPRRKETC